MPKCWGKIGSEEWNVKSLKAIKSNKKFRRYAQSGFIKKNGSFRARFINAKWKNHRILGKHSHLIKYN